MIAVMMMVIIIYDNKHCCWRFLCHRGVPSTLWPTSLSDPWRLLMWWACSNTVSSRERGWEWKEGGHSSLSYGRNNHPSRVNCLDCPSIAGSVEANSSHLLLWLGNYRKICQTVRYMISVIDFSFGLDRFSKVLDSCIIVWDCVVMIVICTLIWQKKHTIHVQYSSLYVLYNTFGLKK